MSDSDWEVKYKVNGKYAELRKTFSADALVEVQRDEHKTKDYGQVLIFVTQDRVRISMNGPCNMSDAECRRMYELIGSAKKTLREA